MTGEQRDTDRKEALKACSAAVSLPNQEPYHQQGRAPFFLPFPLSPKTVTAAALAPATMPHHTLATSHIGHTIPLRPYSCLSDKASYSLLSGTPPENGGCQPT